METLGSSRERQLSLSHSEEEEAKSSCWNSMCTALGLGDAWGRVTSWREALLSPAGLCKQVAASVHQEGKEVPSPRPIRVLDHPLHKGLWIRS